MPDLLKHVKAMNDILKSITSTEFSANEIDTLILMLMARHDKKEPLKIQYVKE